MRVGRKGKHRGSCGLYPAHVVRRVNVVKEMMASDRTLLIEEIQRLFARFKGEIETVENDLRDLIAGFEREAKAPVPSRPEGRRELEREIVEAKRAAGDLVRRISSSLNEEFRHKPRESPTAARRPPGATFTDPWPSRLTEEEPMDEFDDSDDLNSPPSTRAYDEDRATTRGGAGSAAKVHSGLGATGGCARRPSPPNG